MGGFGGKPGLDQRHLTKVLYQYIFIDYIKKSKLKGGQKETMLNHEQQIFDQIGKANNILITFKKVWNGDAIASALALYLFLKKQNKNVDIAAEKFDNGNLFRFLPSYEKIENSLDNLRKFIVSLDITNAKVGQIKYKLEENTLKFIISPKEGFFTHDDIKSRSGDFKYDLIITLDTPDLESLGAIYDNDTEFFFSVPIINFDHHSNNESFGQINCVELTAISTSQILFDLLSNKHKNEIDEDIATCLLAGIISKTRSFKTQNITPQSLSISSELISMGAKREQIVNTLYRSRSINVLKLWGRILARLTSTANNSLVWSILTKTDFEKTSTTEKDLTEVIDELIINIPQAKIIVIIYESLLKSKSGDEKLVTKALVYSVKNINSKNLTKNWQAEGTKAISKVVINQPLQVAEKEIIDHIKNKIEKLLT